MTKKTTTEADNGNLTEALPASLVNTTAAAVPEVLERPLTGGSFARQADGSLAPLYTAAQPAQEPGCHFDHKPQGDGEVVA